MRRVSAVAPGDIGVDAGEHVLHLLRRQHQLPLGVRIRAEGGGPTGGCASPSYSKCASEDAKTENFDEKRHFLLKIMYVYSLGKHTCLKDTSQKTKLICLEKNKLLCVMSIKIVPCHPMSRWQHFPTPWQGGTLTSMYEPATKNI